MTPERLRELETVYFELVELTPEEREHRLAVLEDPSLREHVRGLLTTSEAELSEIVGSTASSLLETLEPERFGPWRVTGILGHGGMGAVYRALRDDGAYQREVAIKVLPSGLGPSALRDRFRQERQILATLDHPNIAHMLDGGESSIGSYIVLEYVDGTDIVSYCSTRHLSIRDRLRLFLSVCAAVQHAHEHAIIHRDLKPANVLITQHGTPKLLDFGIAKLLEQNTLQTAIGFQAFTPQYASPEQVRGGPFTAATDVYALGALLYELLTGVRPHEITSGDPAELVRVICEQEVRRPSSLVRRFDRKLEIILQKALQKQPGRRYASVELLEADISRYLAGKSVLARPDSIAYRSTMFVRRHIAAGVSIISILAFLAALLLHFYNRSPSTTQPDVVPFTSFPGTEVSPSFSPDGKQVAFSWDNDSGDFEIYIKRLDSGPLVKVTHGPGQNVNPAWSPDGRQIAFFRLRRDRTDLMVTTLAGSERLLASTSPPERHAVSEYAVFRSYGPAWSPDGKDLAVVDTCPNMEEECIYLVSASDGTKRLFTVPGTRMSGDRMPSFSPDGTLLAFSRSKTVSVSDIYVQAVKTGSARRLTFDDSGIDGITWGHNGREVIFSSERSGAPELWRLPISGGVTQPIYVGSQNVLQPAISPDGHRLAIVEDVTNENIWRIPVHADQNNRVTKLVSSSRRNDSPRYSPDGKHLAFASERTGIWQIWVSNADGTNPIQITNFKAGLTGSPNWSPDSRNIVFDSRQEDYSAVYIVAATGGVPKRITEKTSDNMLPCWSRDGQWIYFNSNRSGSHEIWKMPAGGGNPIQITRNGAYEPYESFDGRDIYFWKYQGGGVWRVGAQGGQEEPFPQLADYFHTRYFDVTRNGIYFIAHRNEPHPIQFFDFATSKISFVADIDNRMANGTPGLSVSPDGKWIAYAQVDYDSTDIYMVENFR